MADDPPILTTEQLHREAAKLSDRLDRHSDELTAVAGRADATSSSLAALASKQDGDIKRLSSEIEWSNRSVDSALKSHSEIHQLSDKHVDIAREQQQFKNDAANNFSARQANDRKEFALKDTVQVEIAGLRAQLDKNDGRIRELELTQRAILAEDSGADSHKRSGQATVQQLAAVVGMIVAVVTIIIAVVLANVGG